MGIFDRLKPKPAPIQEVASDGSYHEIELLRESLMELELSLAQDSSGWQVIGEMGDTEFSREALRKINRLARLNYLKNPLIRSAVDTQMVYVYGQGITIQAPVG